MKFGSLRVIFDSKRRPLATAKKTVGQAEFVSVSATDDDIERLNIGDPTL